MRGDACACEMTNELVIRGGKRLRGSVRVQGSKNSVLPILAACAAVEGVCTIHNCPRITDVDCTLKILRHLGCRITRNGSSVAVDARDIRSCEVPEALMQEMRSSIVFLGPLLSRFGESVVSAPGGCEIGQRPINLHLLAMQALGAAVEYGEQGRLRLSRQGRLCGESVALALPSVGATENLMIAAAAARGTTVIINAAREPEITDLAAFLNRCGANIRGAGEGTVTIEGVRRLHGCEYRVIPDRIAVSTLMSCAAVTQGVITLEEVVPAHVSPVFAAYEDMGCTLEMGENRLTIRAPRRPARFRTIHTMPYPGFPTDSQATAMAMACAAKGTSVIVENIFENRYKQAAELRRLGAQIEVECRMAVVEGVPQLRAAHVTAPDLRGGAGLVVAGLAAAGETRISAVHLIDRGYEEIEKSLQLLGADVKREAVYGSGKSTAAPAGESAADGSGAGSENSEKQPRNGGLSGACCP